MVAMEKLYLTPGLTGKLGRDEQDLGGSGTAFEQTLASETPERCPRRVSSGSWGLLISEYSPCGGPFCVKYLQSTAGSP